MAKSEIKITPTVSGDFKGIKEDDGKTYNYLPREHVVANPVKSIYPCDKDGKLSRSGKDKARLCIGATVEVVKKSDTRVKGAYVFEECTEDQYRWLYQNKHKHLIKKVEAKTSSQSKEVVKAK